MTGAPRNHIHNAPSLPTLLQLVEKGVKAPKEMEWGKSYSKNPLAQIFMTTYSINQRSVTSEKYVVFWK